MSVHRATGREHVSDDDKTVVDAQPLGRAAYDAHWGQETTLLLSDHARSQVTNVPAEVERRHLPSTRALGRFREFRSVPVGLVVGCGLGLILLLVTGFWVYRERQISDALRDALELAEAKARVFTTIDQVPSSSPPPGASDTDLRGPVELVQAEREQIERRSADLLVANDYHGALDHYLTLSSAFPSEAVFADMVRVLRWRLRCRADRSSRGPPCP